MQDMLTSLQHNGSTAIIVATIFTALTTIAVILRLVTNISVKANWGWSEAMIILAQALWYVQFGVQLHGLIEGRKMKTLMDPHLVIYMRAIYINGEVYFPLIFFTNMSILFLYRRLFPVQSFKRASAFLMILHCLWVIPATVAETLMCSPPSVMWNAPLLIPTKCFFYSSFFIAVCSFELFLDVYVLALPLFYVARLRLPWSRKAELLVIFLLGGLVIITGIVRIVKSVDVGVQAIDFVKDIIWLNVHSGIAIICASLPTYRPLIVKSTAFLSSTASKVFSSGAASGAGSDGRSAKRSGNSSTGKRGFTNATIGSGGGYKNHWRFDSIDEVQLVDVPGSRDEMI